MFYWSKKNLINTSIRYYKYIVLSILGLCSLLVGSSSTIHANFEEFKQNLYEIWVWSDIIEQDRPLFRYDMVRLISTIKCIDCVHPPESIKEEISQVFWSSFITKPGKNFDDTIRRTSNFNDENYFYCVATNAKDEVINGYPRLTNVLCPWRFCGTNLLTQWELIQIIYNIAKFQTEYDYEINWNKVKSRLDGLDRSSNEYNFFNDTDKTNIQDGITDCWSNMCDINTPSQLDTFAKYCTYQPNDCSFVYFGNTTVWQRPLGELNILIDGWILTIVEADKILPNEVSTTQQILSLIYRLNLKLQCEFDLDYDKDGISNQNDNCPYTYNPSQSDMDQDGIWDVCDEDIDWDGVLNPIGIINDQGVTDINKIINTKTLEEIVKTYIIDKSITTWDIEINMWYDRCPFDSSVQEIIFDKNNYGIECNNIIKSGTALTIETTLDLTDDRNIAIFEAISSWVDCRWDYRWEFWDGSIWQNKRITHRYIEKWWYTVKVEDCVWNIAITQVYFWKNELDHFALQIIPDKLNGPVDFVSNIYNQRYGDYESIKWQHEDGLTTLSPEETFVHGYKNTGLNPVIAYGWKNDQIRAISKANLYVYDSWVVLSSFLRADKINPNIWDRIRLVSYISGFNTGDIESVKRDLDDDNVQENNNIEIYHVYFNPGTKIITQTITLKDKSKLENIIQLYVSDIDNSPFYANLKADPLVWYIWDQFDFNVQSPYISDISTYTRSVSDWTHTMTTGPSLIKKFYRPGIQNVLVKLTLTNKQIYDLAISVDIKENDICSDPKKLENYQCDMDEDGVPDICDTDIDGDGYKNIIWIIIDQDEECNPVINPDLLDDNGNLSNNDPSIDNCPFIPSSNQSNADSDQYGDICDPNPNIPEPDNKWVKPYIPSHKQPDTWWDGRPVTSIWDIWDITWPSNIENNCISCPCQFYNNLWPVMPGDVVQAVIKYDWWYIYSNPFLVK